MIGKRIAERYQQTHAGNDGVGERESANHEEKNPHDEPENRKVEVEVEPLDGFVHGSPLTTTGFPCFKPSLASDRGIANATPLAFDYSLGVLLGDCKRLFCFCASRALSIHSL